MKAAFMVIDMQRAYCKGAAAPSMDSAVEYINATLPVFRSNGLPIIWVQHIDEDDGAVPGREGFELIPGLAPLETEPRIHKRYGNSFNKTDCAGLLAASGVDTVILSGYCAEYCVLSTYRGALDLDLTPALLRNGIASGSQQNLELVERISSSISFGILKKFLG